MSWDAFVKAIIAVADQNGWDYVAKGTFPDVKEETIHAFYDIAVDYGERPGYLTQYGRWVALEQHA